MKLLRTPRFVRSYAKAPREVQRAFDKQAFLMVRDFHHPSLRAKKYDDSQNLWQARVNRDWRFYFLIQDGGYLITDIIPHPK